MKNIIHNQRGAVIVVFALVLAFLLGMVALGIEAGRWYLVRAELSKAVDAAALAGARNISNPHVNAEDVAEEFGMENLAAGTLGTPGSGVGVPTFTATLDAANRKVSVTGTTDASRIISRLFLASDVTVRSTGAAKKTDVDIMLVLDKTGSMGWCSSGGTYSCGHNKIEDLKTAAKAFVEYFKDTQADDRLGLVSYSVGCTIDPPSGYHLGNNFYNGIKTAIEAMTASGNTDIADALNLSITSTYGLQPVVGRKQFLVLFTDGVPNVLRSNFRRNGTARDAAVKCNDNYCASSSGIYTYLIDQNTGADTSILSMPTGSGAGATTYWKIFETYPSGYSNPVSSNRLATYIKNTSRALSVEYANTIKGRDILVYVVGLGADADESFLKSLASGDVFYYHAPTSDQLEAIFRAIAKDIKLRLVE